MSSWLTEPFWSAAAGRRLVRPVCDRCARSFFTPQAACPFCQSLEWTYRLSSGRGSVYTFTTVHRAPVPGRAVPYVVAIVDMEEGWQMLSNLVDCEPEAVAFGLPVEVTWSEDPAHGPLPVFRPARTAAAAAS